MTRWKRRYSREFKISVVAELERCKSSVSGTCNKYKDQARIAEPERLIGQAHAEIELFEKAFNNTEKKIQ